MDRYTAERLPVAPGELAEGPVWLASSEQVTWVDIHGRSLWRAGWPPGGDGWTPELVTRVDDPLGAALPATDGGTVLAHGLTLEHRHPDGRQTIVRLPDEDVAGVAGLRLNDCACDPAGRLLAGTMSHAPFGRAALYCLDGGQLGRLLDGVGISNGLGWSPDGATLYYADSATGRVDRFDYDVDDGRLSQRRPFCRIDGGDPDGLCVDVEGAVWVACWGAGEVRRFAPSGDLLAVVPVPTPQVSSCAFVGAERRDLLITTGAEGLSPAEREADPNAGAVFVVRDLPVAGLARAAYAG